MIETALTLIVCHMVGDYFFQNNFIASTKGANWYHLTVHCVLYAIPFWIAFGWCWQLALVTLSHFPIDALKARYKKITYVQDQILHYLLALSYFV